MQKNLDPTDKARLLNQAYETLCESGEGWTLDMLANMRQLVLEAEEEEHIYIMNQEYIIEQQAKADGHISEQDMEDMFDHYESLRIDNAKDTL